MPTLKAIHICNSHKPTLKPKIPKEYVFANAINRMEADRVIEQSELLAESFKK